jgi:hypothetical protein
MSWRMMLLMMHPILVMQKHAVPTIANGCLNINLNDLDVKWRLWIVTDFVRVNVALNKDHDQILQWWWLVLLM